MITPLILLLEPSSASLGGSYCRPTLQARRFWSNGIGSILSAFHKTCEAASKDPLITDEKSHRKEASRELS